MSRVCQFFISSIQVIIHYSGGNLFVLHSMTVLEKKQHLSSECLQKTTPKNEQPLKNDGTET